MVPPTYTIRNFHLILTQFPKLFKKQIEDKVKKLLEILLHQHS